MLIANHQGLGESANELVKKFGTAKYRYGAPDFYAAEFPVRPMYYDQSRIYAGVIGRHYPEAQTSRYHYLYDPNMYLQPGFGAAGMSSNEAIAVLQKLLDSAPANAFKDFDVVFDTSQATGSGIDPDNRLWIIHGKTFEAVRQATAAAGGTVAVQTLTTELARRIARARQVAFQDTIANGTLGKVDDVRAAIENMITVLKSGDAIPVAVAAINIVQPSTLSRNAKIAIAGGTVLALGGLAAFLLARR